MLLMLKGLPASGKTTYAKELVDKGYIRINKDDLRAMLNNSIFSKINEENIIEARNNLIKQYLKANNNVVVDDTNFNEKHEQELKKIAYEFGIDFEVKFFDVSVEECIRRDALRQNPVGKNVIFRMYNQYLIDNTIFSNWNLEKGKIPAIIVDIDGTLAHFNGRSPYDYSKVENDICDIFIKDIIKKYFNDNYDIIVVSGREDSCIEETRDWLYKNDIPTSKLFMRLAGDKREDSIIKKEIYENEIKPNYSVFLVLDDRDKVVEMWRSLGLKCLQCGYGNF